MKCCCGLLVLLCQVGGVALAGDDGDVAVRVTGRVRSLNGVDTVPARLFGVHAGGLKRDRIEAWGIESERVLIHGPNGVPQNPDGIRHVVECYFDRFRPALQVTERDWRGMLVRLATNYAERARAHPPGTRAIEFWNEPYLNWATLPGLNYHGMYYHQEEAAPGKPMRLRTTGERVEGLAWDRERFFAFNRFNRLPDYFKANKIEPDAPEGVPYRMRNGVTAVLTNGAIVDIYGPTLIRKEWIGRDVAQKHYWSGPVNLRWYIEMFNCFGEALKTANPDVRLAAGWGFNLFNENWDCWRLLAQPTIDAGWKWMDAFHEHHYGGNTKNVAASYEVAYAYTLHRHGKRLKFWNTECGGYLDPEQPGNAGSGTSLTGAEKDRAAFTYMVRDLAYLLAVCPDKAEYRAAHEPGRGEELAFRLLKPLRGRLLDIDTAQRDVWCVAAATGQAVTVFLYNDTRAERRVTVELPLGTGVPPVVTLRGLLETPDGIDLRSETTAEGTGTVVVVLGPREAAVLEATYAAGGAAPMVTQERQYPAEEILAACGPKERVGFTIRIPSAELVGVDGAGIVIPGDVGHEAIELNGARVPPAASGPATIRIDPGLLRPENRLELIAGDTAGCFVPTVSLLLTRHVAE